MKNISKRRMVENRKAQARVLSALTAEQQEAIIDLLEAGQSGEALSYPDAVTRVEASYGVKVTPDHLRHWADGRLLSRRFARAVSSSSSLASISAAQRSKLKAALKDRSRLRLHDLLSELRPTEASDRSLARIGSMIDSFDRTDLATQAHELNERTALLREQDIALRAREQDRKDESLKLEIQKHEETRRRTREELERQAGKGGITAEAKKELIAIMSGAMPA